MIRHITHPVAASYIRVAHRIIEAESGNFAQYKPDASVNGTYRILYTFPILRVGGGDVLSTLSRGAQQQTIQYCVMARVAKDPAKDDTVDNAFESLIVITSDETHLKGNVPGILKTELGGFQTCLLHNGMCLSVTLHIR